MCVQVVVCSCSAAGMLREGRALEAYVQGVAAAATHAMRPGSAAPSTAAAAAGVAAVGGGCIEFTHVMVDEAGQVCGCVWDICRTTPECEPGFLPAVEHAFRLPATAPHVLHWPFRHPFRALGRTV